MIIHSDAELELHELESVCGGGRCSETKAELIPNWDSANARPLKTAILWFGQVCEMDPT